MIGRQTLSTISPSPSPSPLNKLHSLSRSDAHSPSPPDLGRKSSALDLHHQLFDVKRPNIGPVTEPPANTQSNDRLDITPSIPLLSSSKIEHITTDGMVTPKHRPPSHRDNSRLQIVSSRRTTEIARSTSIPGLTVRLRGNYLSRLDLLDIGTRSVQDREVSNGLRSCLISPSYIFSVLTSKGIDRTQPWGYYELGS